MLWSMRQLTGFYDNGLSVIKPRFNGIITVNNIMASLNAHGKKSAVFVEPTIWRLVLTIFKLSLTIGKTGPELIQFTKTEKKQVLSIQIGIFKDPHELNGHPLLKLRVFLSNIYFFLNIFFYWRCLLFGEVAVVL